MAEPVKCPFELPVRADTWCGVSFVVDRRGYAVSAGLATREAAEWLANAINTYDALQAENAALKTELHNLKVELAARDQAATQLQQRLREIEHGEGSW